MIDATYNVDLQPLVRRVNLDILKHKRGVGTTEQYTQFQRHLEVLQHRSKRSRDIFQQGFTLDERGLE